MTVSGGAGPNNSSETAGESHDGFANALSMHFDDAMDRFMGHAEDSASARGMTAEQVREHLDRGYGEVVADAWWDWSEGEVRP